MKCFRIIFSCLILIALTSFSISGFSQIKAPFYQEIEKYKKQDSLQNELDRPVLFIGSSSLRFWKDLEQTFKEYKVLNRGFGGSSLTDAIYYADDIIYPYHPKQIFIYSGENDIASGASPEITFDRFKILFNLLRKKIPEVPIIFISIKPSISRQNLMPQFKKANQLIHDFLKTKPATDYVDVFTVMLNESDSPMNDIFLADKLHMNQKGYDIWIKALKPYLDKYN